MSSAAKTSPWAASFAAVFLIIGLVASLYYNQLDPMYLGLAGLGLISSFAIALWDRAPSGSWPLTGPLWLLGLVWFWWFLLSGFSPVLYLSESATWTLAALPASAIITLWLRHSQWFVSITVTAVGLLLASLAVMACYQFFIQVQQPSATFLNKNNFAALEMLVALSATGIALQHGRGWRSWAGMGLMGLLVFVVGLVGSRGALLTLVTSMVILLVLAFRKGASRNSVVSTGLIFIGATGSAQLASMGQLGERVSSLADPWTAGGSRFAIWRGSLELAQDAPWHGIGPGLYWLFYPPYRAIEDQSAAFYAHNDYLQFLIETGWPGLLLILASMAMLAWWTIPRLMARSATDQSIEASGLFCGLLAVVTHSLLTFNLYLMPVLFVMGLAIGRLLSLLGPAFEDSLEPTTRTKPVFNLSLTLLLLIPLNLYINALASGWHYHRMEETRNRSAPLTAMAHINSAISWWPDVDLYHYVKAQMLLKSARAIEGDPAESTLSAIRSELDKAVTLNPYRPETRLLRGRFYQALNQSPDADTSPAEAARIAYRHALALDPYFLRARFRLGRLLLEANHIEAGMAVLEENVEHRYPSNKVTLNYFRLLSRTHEALENPAKAAHYRKRLQEVAGKPAPASPGSELPQ
ncbi:O-antigen ligase family protein [Salicola sp. Rm-C-2C1-2]|uniref:O-antigen ligase family protein n=1 Tax=Salicola sp. Rm-C-2C1-2 TaxID=3141321 RepID=UPI0032E4B76F